MDVIKSNEIWNEKIKTQNNYVLTVIHFLAEWAQQCSQVTDVLVELQNDKVCSKVQFLQALVLDRVSLYQMDNIRLGCAACRIVLYRLWNRITGHVPPPSKPQKHVVCIGLSNSGKSAALALAAGEQIDALEPTEGFHIKDIQLDSCLLTVKEIGGSEKIRKYWPHYYSGAQGVIFMVDGSGDDAELEVAKDAMVEALQDEQLSDLPILLLVTHQDVEKTHPKSANEIGELWGVKDLYQEQLTIYSTSIKHIKQLRAAFNTFGDILVNGTASPSDVRVE